MRNEDKVEEIVYIICMAWNVIRNDLVRGADRRLPKRLQVKKAVVAST